MGRQRLLLTGLLLCSLVTVTTAFIVGGVECYVCDGELCGVIPGNDPLQRCPEATPFCLTIINYDKKGSRHVTKRCGTKGECRKEWWLDTSGRDLCTQMKPDSFYPTSLSCTFCCTHNKCNDNLVPAQNTLYYEDR